MKEKLNNLDLYNCELKEILESDDKLKSVMKDELRKIKKEYS